MPRKPTGRIGPARLSLTPKGPEVSWNEVSFPEAKADIEAKIVRYFVDSFRKHGATILGVQQNEESNFDFTLKLPGGDVALELREVHFGQTSGNPYLETGLWVASLPYAEQIALAVEEKSRKYCRLGTPVDLLLYITHWRFVPSETVVRLAQYLINFQRPLFENVFFLIPFDAKDAQLRLLYPSVDPLNGRDLKEYSDHAYMNLHPDRWKSFSA